jgi:hypothetical protein
MGPVASGLSPIGGLDRGRTVHTFQTVNAREIGAFCRCFACSGDVHGLEYFGLTWDKLADSLHSPRIADKIDNSSSIECREMLG